MKKLLSNIEDTVYQVLNWVLRILRLLKGHIISLLKNTWHNFIKGIHNIFIFAQNVFEQIRFKNLLNLIGALDLRYPGTITVLIVLIGIFLNYLSKEKLPYFIIFQAMLLFTLCAAYYSIRKIIRFNAQASSFQIHSAGEPEILAMRIKYERISGSSYNYILPIIFGGSIALIVSDIFSMKIDFVLRIYCFSALAVILVVCAIGFFQYFFFVYFLIRLAQKANKIKAFDTALPAKTDWLIDLANMANWYSTMYFLVGLVYILLFYSFSFSPAFGVLNLLPNERFPLYFLWGIIIVVIIIGFPITTITGLIALRTITVRLRSHQETNLRRQRASVSDISLQTAIDSLLILLDNTPTIPQKPVIGYIGSFIISAINLFASIQAVIQFIPSSI